MKSFHLYLEPPATVPERYVSDYPSGQQSEFRERFRPLAERYRRCQRVANIVALFALGFGLPLLAIRSATTLWLFVPCFLCLAVYAGIAFLVPVPKCPACHNRLDQAFGDFCPACGVRALERTSWPQDPTCFACARKMSRRRGHRHYRIRACTHCGVRLDEIGL